MKMLIYQFLHVGSVMMLAVWTFYVLANPDPKHRKKWLAITGVLALIVLVTGFGLLAVLQYGFPGWVIVKLVCWLGLAGSLSMAYRKSQWNLAVALVLTVLLLLAIAMVTFKPF